MSEQQRVDGILRRHRAVNDRKGPWLSHWDDLARVMLPRRLGFVTQTHAGDRRHEDIFDGTAMRAARGLANAIAQMTRPEGEQWIFMRTEDDALDNLDEVKDWLGLSEQRLIEAVFNPKARFRQAMGEADLDLTVFGTDVVFTGRARLLDHLTYQTLSLKDAAVGFDDEGNPDTLFVEHRFTVRQAVAKFGAENLGEQTQQKLQQSQPEKGLEEKIRFLHGVVPRPNGRGDALLARNLPHAEVWIEVEAKKIVGESGFHEFPFAVTRWDTSSGEDYGRSPGMVALPDAATAQAMGETILVAGERAADPPLFAPNDGSFDAANTFPGGISYYDVETAKDLRGNPFFPLESGTNLPITRDMQQDTRQQIEAAFFKNVFNLPVPGTQMTATEIRARLEEFIREIGPVFGRLETDRAPIVERSFAIMLRSGSFDPIPDVLQGQNVRFEFESPVKKIREQALAAAANAWAAEVVAMSEARPEVLDNLDADALARFSHEALNLPPQLIVEREKIEQVRTARAEAERDAAEREKVAQEVQIAQGVGGAAKDAAEVLTTGEAA